MLRRASSTSLLALVLAGAASGATLQIDTPWNLSGANTGSVGGTALSATASTGWSPAFGDESAIYAYAGFGSLALPAGSVGDFFRIDLGTQAPAGLTSTLTVTLAGALEDPIFYLIDLNGVGATVTVSPGGSSFTTTAEGTWNGNLLTMSSGTRLDAAVQYSGVFPAGSVFSFAIDYGETTGISSDSIGLGIATPVAEPSALCLLALAAGAGARRLRRMRGSR
jgi:hypothetical protein